MLGVVSYFRDPGLRPLALYYWMLRLQNALPATRLLGTKEQLQEDVGAATHLIIFYPKFHCELNFIERSQVVRQRGL